MHAEPDIVQGSLQRGLPCTYGTSHAGDQLPMKTGLMCRSKMFFVTLTAVEHLGSLRLSKLSSWFQSLVKIRN